MNCPKCNTNLQFKYLAWDLDFKRQHIIHFGYLTCPKCNYQNKTLTTRRYHDTNVTIRNTFK